MFRLFFIFSPDDSPLNNYEKSFIFHLKISFRFRDIQIFIFSYSQFFSLSVIALGDDGQR